ncbi:MAG: diphosphomevalonate decarboxylase [Deltaproteobacteria bacterium]|nr:diphosphomevalonate decarboxylase [Deltaproteobacteria bacterium]
MTGVGRVRARANIALAKYWGKCDTAHNLPAVPSVSVTLDALVTETEVALDPSLDRDLVLLQGTPRDGPEADKIRSLLAELRTLSGSGVYTRVSSHNLFPSASGLASSASGFAALVAAGERAYGLGLSLEAQSALARRGSASAARSLFGGFVELPSGVPGDGTLAARALHPPEHWDVRVVIAMTTLGAKDVASRAGMRHTAETSPYYAAWLGCAPGYAREVRDGIAARDLERVGRAMEASTAAMHASAWAAVPGVRYFKPSTVALLDRVEALRREGIGAWSTMDAGPHVKVLCLAADAPRVERALRAVEGVVELRVSRPGPGIEPW